MSRWGWACIKCRPPTRVRPWASSRPLATTQSSRRALNFLADLLSDEVFIYGGPSVNQTIDLLQGFVNDAQFAGIAEGFRETHEKPTTGKPTHAKEFGDREVAQAFVKRIHLLKFPELVIGFKVKDKALAKELLDELDTNLQLALAQARPCCRTV